MSVRSRTPKVREAGPFRVDELREGGRYELRDGHPIYCAPAGRDHAGRNLTGAAVLESDPEVEWAGVDAGFTPTPGDLRAPDVAVAPARDDTGDPAGEGAGWIPGVPPLAVEYAGRGQDLTALAEKIDDLLAHGTRLVWVVHLVGPRRVEVFSQREPVRVLGPGDVLHAPGILRNPVPVEALYDRDAGHRAVLRNLLQRAGYDGIDAIRAEGVALGIEQGLELGIERGMARAVLVLLDDRGLAPTAEQRARIEGCRDADQLRRWLLAAARVERAAELFDD